MTKMFSINNNTNYEKLITVLHSQCDNPSIIVYYFIPTIVHKLFALSGYSGTSYMI